jgi:hypothetical protein
LEVEVVVDIPRMVQLMVLAEAPFMEVVEEEMVVDALQLTPRVRDKQEDNQELI